MAEPTPVGACTRAAAPEAPKRVPWRKYEFDDETLAELRRRYEETDESGVSIARALGTSDTHFYRMANDRGWVKFKRGKIGRTLHPVAAGERNPDSSGEIGQDFLVDELLEVIPRERHHAKRRLQRIPVLGDQLHIPIRARDEQPVLQATRRCKIEQPLRGTGRLRAGPLKALAHIAREFGQGMIVGNVNDGNALAAKGARSRQRAVNAAKENNTGRRKRRAHRSLEKGPSARIRCSQYGLAVASTL